LDAVSRPCALCLVPALTIEFLSPVCGVSFPAEFYDIGEEGHFWMQWRLAVALRLVKASGLMLDRPHRALDIGGGAGRFREQIERATQWRVDMTDLHLPALKMAGAARGRTLYYDVTQSDPSLLGSYDAAFLFDVIEHVPTPGPLLRAALDHLRPGGCLFLNVPALPRLFSAYDVVQGHVRRYSARTLAAELAGLPCELGGVSYWGLGLVPLLGLRRLWVGRTPGAKTYRVGFQPSPAANHVLKALMRVELAVLARPPLGTSVIAVARKTV
jgi:SAM-dependent methyltransferase